MILPSQMRRQLLSKLVDIASVLTAFFFVVAMLPGASDLIYQSEAVVLVLLLLLRLMIKRDVKHCEHLFVGLILATITYFDDGYGGVDSTWVLHIPLTLCIWVLVESAKGRVFWLSMQILSIGLVNHTQLTPRIDTMVQGTSPIWNNHLNVLSTVIASLLLVRYLHKLNQDILAEAQKQRRQAEAASRAKDEFLSHMSHELRTPLNAIQGFSDLALQTMQTSSEGLEENLRSIRHSAEHLTHLVNDILDLARLENGSLALACGGFGPASCIVETLDLLRPLAREKNIELFWDGDMNLPRVLGDRVRWKQILLNLVGNAIKYTRKGHVRLASKWEPTSQEMGVLTIRVTDTGNGIAPQDQEKIFQRFQRLGGFDAPSGTGLGLAISDVLAKAMGGIITLQSQLGTGSTFSLAIPFRQTTEDPASQTQLSLATPRSLRGCRILLAEDNRVNIRLATQVLTTLNAEFDVAEDGGKALEFLRANRYDLLLLDLHMPVKDGFEVALEIRDPDSNVLNHDIPILALTADAFEETKRRALEAGMDDFLPKPFRIVDLADRVSRLVHKAPDYPIPSFQGPLDFALE